MEKVQRQELLLEALAQTLDEEPVKDAKGSSTGSLTLPIHFNPWLYEAESHKIIPLLKTTKPQIGTWLDRRLPKTDLEGTREWLSEKT